MEPATPLSTTILILLRNRPYFVWVGSYLSFVAKPMLRFSRSASIFSVASISVNSLLFPFLPLPEPIARLDSSPLWLVYASQLILFRSEDSDGHSEPVVLSPFGRTVELSLVLFSGGYRFSFPPRPKLLAYRPKDSPPRRAPLKYWAETISPPPGPPCPPKSATGSLDT